MIKIVQQVHNLLGSEEDIASLADKDRARILVVSDSHGAKEMFKAIIRARGGESDALVFCGDGVSDLLSVLSVKGFPPVAAFVRGNNDYGNYSIGGQAIAVPARQVLQAAGHTLFIAHGHRQGVMAHYSSALMSEAHMAGADIVLFGHTHVAEESDNAINPGSLKYSRGMAGSSFAMLDIRNGGGIDAAFFTVTATLTGVAIKAFRPG